MTARHRLYGRVNGPALALAVLLAALLAGLVWSLWAAHGDCLTGRAVGPWC